MSRRDGGFFGDPSTRGNGPPNIEGMVTLKIDNIPYNATVDELRRTFESVPERFGKLGDVYMPRDLRSGEPRGFAFVRYLHQRDADDAIDRLDGEFFAGRQLRIQYAKRRRPEYGGGSGGFGGGRYGGRDDRRDDGYRRHRSRSRSPRRRSRTRSPPRHRSRSRSHPRRSHRGRHASKSRSPSPRQEGRRRNSSADNGGRRREKDRSRDRDEDDKRGVRGDDDNGKRHHKGTGDQSPSIVNGKGNGHSRHHDDPSPDGQADDR